MKRSISYSLILLLFASACAEDEESIEDPAAAQEEVSETIEQVAGDRVQHLSDNAYIEVMRVTLAPGDSLRPHRGGERVVYSLNDYTVALQQSGQHVERSFSQGDAHFHEAGVHAVENVGNTQAEFVVFERREAALPEAPAGGEAADLGSQTAPASSETLLENPSAEVHRIDLAPGEQLPPHTGYARAVYALSDYTVEFHEADQQTERSFQAGDVHFHEPERHWVENTSDATASFLVVEFKRAQL